jgi:hypothetical protein
MMSDVVEIMAKAVRTEFIDRIRDTANPHWGEQRPDYIKEACKRAGYPNPEEAADFFARAAALSALRALASSSMPAMIRKEDGTLILSQEGMDIFKRTCAYLADGEIL